jgi:hypothetical protein
MYRQRWVLLHSAGLHLSALPLMQVMFTYCNVPGVLFTMEVYFRQHTTVKYNQPFSKHTSGVCTQRCHTQTWPLVVISQHELTFLQSESFHTQVRAQSLRSSVTNSHSCNQRASKHTCSARSFPALTQSSNRQQSVTKHTHVYTRRFPNTDWLQINRSL